MPICAMGGNRSEEPNYFVWSQGLLTFESCEPRRGRKWKELDLIVDIELPFPIEKENDS